MAKRRAKSDATMRKLRASIEALEPRLVISGTIVLGQQPGAPNNVAFHGDAARTGFQQNETVLTQSNVASSLGQVWQSPVFNDNGFNAHVYATPLFADSIGISGNIAAAAGQDGIQSASYAGKSLGLVFAATGGGSVYAVAGQDTNGASGIAPGTIVWQKHLGSAYSGIDGNTIGVLATPVIDLKAQRLYVVGSVNFAGQNNFWVFALNLRDGSIVSGWPMNFTQTLLDSLNTNTLVSGAGAKLAVQFSQSGADNRGALNLSANGDTLYVDFACYGSSNPGWMTTVATGITNGVSNGQTPAIVGAYSAVDNASTSQNGGMWGAGGPSIDPQGNVFVTTGDSPGGTGNPIGDFSNSVMEFGPGQTLQLTGLYSPWNWPTQDTIDSDMGGGSPIVVTLPAGSSTTTDLVATGGKQGNGYLADAGNHLNNPTNNPHSSPAAYPADLTRRPPNNLTPQQDASLYDTTATGIRSYWVSPNGPQDGPLAVFGPYNESSASGDTAKARDTPATFTDASGNQYVIFAGTSKTSVGSSTPVAPSVVVTKIVHTAGNPAYLQIVSQNKTVFSNAGSNMITGNNTSNEIDWVVDSGVLRTAGLTSFSNGDPVLYAFDALTMQPLWSSAFQELDMGGKYNSLAVARGQVLLGTDRIQAFGLTGNTIVDDSVSGTGTNQFNYHGSGWTHVTGASTMTTFDATVSTDNVMGDSATMTFSGSAIKIFANEVSTYGTLTYQVDGGALQTVNLGTSPTSPNGQGQGDVLMATVTNLGAGTHTLSLINNSASNTISIDRVEIVPNASANAKLGVSVADGQQIPSGSGAVIPYTVNWNNQGSIASTNPTGNANANIVGYGTNANSVVVTDTVPANTTFDAANSTAGWTLQTAGAGGAGSAGSTYTYSVGLVKAGTAGSAVFSVDLNSNIPVGTTTVTDNVSITDAANDNGSNSRVTPIPPPAESQLIFNVEPPTSGGANIALSPAPQVTIRDQFGNTFSADSSSTVTLTLDHGTFSNGLSTATATVSSGVATFSSLVFATAGTYTFTASDGALATTLSSPVVIAATSKLAITGQPTTATAGSPMGNITVAVENQNSQIITTDSSVVTLTLNTGQFSNGSTTATAQAVNGVATFTGLTINQSGSYTMVASDGALITAQTTPINVNANATKLVFVQQPNNTYLGEAINPTVQVGLEDQFGNLAAGNTSNVTLTLSGGATFFDGSTSVTMPAGSNNALNNISTAGVAIFNNLVTSATGTYTLTATSAGLTSAISAQFTVASHALTVIDDNNANNAAGNQITYSPAANWVRTSTALANNFDGTVTTSSANSDQASLTFNGTLVTLYIATNTTNTSAAAQIFIDGGAYSAIVSTYSPTAKIIPIYASPVLMTGSHTIQVQALNGAGSVSIDKFVVGPATPAIFWSPPVPISYGTALTGTQLSAFITSYAGFQGSFVYTPPIGTVLGAGNQTLSTTFTPTDTTNYDTPASVSVPLTVTKTAPTITWQGPFTDLTFGQALSNIQLDATATLNGSSVPGTFVYTPTFGFVPPAGANYPLHLDFTPTDTADFTSVSVDRDVDVDPAMPVINWPTPADIVDGTPLSSTQLNATVTGVGGATVPGTFAYSPVAQTVLPVGQHQAISVTFTPDNTDQYSVVGQTDFINVVLGAAAQLAFKVQPNNIPSGGTISPAVQVAIEDSAGSVVTNNTSTVTLTISSGTFANGQTTATAQAVNGIATFSTLSVNANGSYRLTATDGALTSIQSAPFNVGSTIFLDFNTGATDSFTPNFAVNNNGAAGGTMFAYNASAGIWDQEGGGAQGGGVTLTSGGDNTAVYQPFAINLSDGKFHTASLFEQTGSLGSGDRSQLGFVTGPAGPFNSGFSFISARVYGDGHTEFQSANGGAATSTNTSGVPAGVTSGDWLQLIFSVQETASGSFNEIYTLEDFGPKGISVPTTVLGPTSATVSGLTNIGTGSSVYAGWRVSSGGAGFPQAYDNFAVDDPAHHVLYLSQPTSTTAGVPFSTPFVAAVEDINSNIIAGNSDTVQFLLNHGTFSNGATFMNVQAVNGVATLSGAQINAPGGYILIAKDITNTNLDLGFAPITVNGPTKLGFTQQPLGGAVGAPLNPVVKVGVEDASGTPVAVDTSTVTLTLDHGTFSNTGTNTMSVAAVNGVATFTGLQINTTGMYTVTATDGTLTSAVSNQFTISTGPAKLLFIAQPISEPSGTALPSVSVGVYDGFNALVANNTSTVTLTLSSGNFVNTGTPSMSIAAVAGVATFNNIAVSAVGTYTVTASDGTLNGATSNVFAITDNPRPFYVNFNNGAVDFANNFTVFNDGGINNTSLNFGATAGITDQSNNTVKGGGVTSDLTTTVDSTAVYNSNTINLADGNTHTLSEWVTDNPVGNANKMLQLGYLAPGSTNFNANFTFISARILGDNTVEFQSNNGAAAVSSGNVAMSGVATGDWLQLIFTAKQTAVGSFTGSYAVVDFGTTGQSAGFYALAPTAYTVSGVTLMGSGTADLAGFRTQTPASAGTLAFDNFSDDPATTTIDDTITTGTTNKVTYSGNGWVTTGASASDFNSTLHSNSTTLTVTGRTATVTFNGSQIIYYADLKPTFGSVTVHIDTGANTTVNMYSATATGSIPVYESPILTPGTHTLTISITNTAGPGGSKGASVDRFDIIKATPTIVWNKPAAITQGTALSFTQLNATASVAGTFVYTQPSGTVLPGGANETLNVAFVPTDTTNYAATADTTTITVLPALASNKVGDGSAQRSTFKSISLTFNEAVNFNTSSFTLFKATQNASGTVTGYTNDVSTGVSLSSTDNITWVLSVIAGGSVDRGGAGTTGNAFFADGVYQLILHNNAITDHATGQTSVGNGNQTVSFQNAEPGGTGTALAFHSLYGDTNGDATVSNGDLNKLKQAFTATGGVYNASLDYEGDGNIGNSDLNQFKKRFGLMYSY